MCSSQGFVLATVTFSLLDRDLDQDCCIVVVEKNYINKNQCELIQTDFNVSDLVVLFSECMIQQLGIT